jgi:hypothetical protein
VITFTEPKFTPFVVNVLPVVVANNTIDPPVVENATPVAAFVQLP